MSDTTTQSSQPRLEQRWAAVRTKLESNRDHLARQGALVTKRVKGKAYLVVRFAVESNGRRVLRMIHVGPADDHELAERVRALLDDYRQPERLPRELAWMARVAGALRAALRPPVRRRPKGRWGKSNLSTAAFSRERGIDDG